MPFMPYVLKAFPDTPWIFIHRNPVEVMVSNLKTKKASDCLRGGPTKEIQTILSTDRAGAMAASDEDKCAAQLAVLCETAVKHLLPVRKPTKIYLYKQTIGLEFQKIRKSPSQASCVALSFQM